MSESYKKSPSKGEAKYLVLGAALVASLVISMSILGGVLQVEIQPYHFLFFTVEYSGGEGGYIVSFALLNDEMVNGPSNGYVTLKVFDADNSTVYQDTFVLRASNFSSITDPQHGGNAIGYSFIVPVAKFTANTSANTTMLLFQITYLSMAGRSVTAGTTAYS